MMLIITIVMSMIMRIVMILNVRLTMLITMVMPITMMLSGICTLLVTVMFITIMMLSYGVFYRCGAYHDNADHYDAYRVSVLARCLSP